MKKKYFQKKIKSVASVAKGVKVNIINTLECNTLLK